MRTRLLLAAVLALALLTAACGEPTATPTTPTPTPTDTAVTPATPATPDDEPTSPEPTAEPTDVEGEDATAFFVRSHDSGIWVEPLTLPVGQSGEAMARAAVELLLEGPSGHPALTTEVPDGTELLDVNISDRVLVVDLSEEVRGRGGASAQEVAFAQQLAHTGAQFDTVDAVQLWVEGEPVDELWGHLDWSEPIEPDPFALSPITFDSHEWGERVTAGRVTVGGEANTFEATVELRLLAPDGSVAEETFTTATSGTGTRGTWEHTFDLDEPGRWTIEAIEPDPSDGEGRPPFVTTLELDVR
jgi:hypothetical protein